ncbi:hypothetical protein [Agilicoccus flavus]|uniref:hypothetical protein n=1 Tax=Agilicoccus flavus TaxID=2775968 RepID=UPI001CF64D12|nr:hypothetical protein [Agilicoccus flavus]
MALGVVGSLVALRTPAWLVVVVLLPVLALCSSAATYVMVWAGPDDAEAISPINGYVVGFAVVWAVRLVPDPAG